MDKPNTEKLEEDLVDADQKIEVSPVPVKTQFDSAGSMIRKLNREETLRRYDHG